MFNDRIDAGCKLAAELNEYKDKDCIIIGIPRGGVLIACCIATSLNKPWDIIMPRKIAAPFNSEIAIGAISQEGDYYLNSNLITKYNISNEYIEEESSLQLNKIKRGLNKYRGNCGFPDVKDKIVILVDDGIATGFTFKAGIKSIMKHNPLKVVAAVPIASIEGIDMLKKYLDQIVCLEIPKLFSSVGKSYIYFEENSDEQIISLFKQHYKKVLI